MAISLGAATITIDTDIKGLRDNLKAAKSVIDGSINDIKDKAKTISGSIGGALSGAIGNIGGVVDHIRNIGLENETVFKGIAAGLNLLPEKFNSFKSNAGKAVGFVSETVGELNLSFTDLLSPMGAVQVASGILGKVVVANLDVIIDYITEAINAFIDLYNNSIIFRGAVESIVAQFKILFDVVRFVVKQAINGFSTIGKVIKAALNGDLSDIPNIIAGYFKEGADLAIDTGKSIGSRIGTAINNTVSGKMENISRDDVAGFINKFRSFGAEAAKVMSDEIAVRTSSILGNVGSSTPSIGFQLPGLSALGEVIDYDPLKNVKKSILEAVELNKVFGKSYDLVASKVEILESSISSLIQNGFTAASPQVEALKKKLGELNTTMVTNAIDLQSIVQASVQSFADNIANVIVSAGSITEVFGGIGKSAGNAFANVLNGVGDAAIKLGTTMIAVKSALSFGNPFAAIGTGIALKVFSGTIKGLLTDTPRLAKGGLAFGETLAVVGDNPNAQNDPEVIAPLSKLKSMIGGGMGDIILRSIVKGEDILLVGQRAQENQRRVTGR